MQVWFEAEGETWVREVDAVPRAGDIIDRQNGGNYVVVSIHWVDYWPGNNIHSINMHLSPTEALPIMKMRPHLVVREMQ